MDAKPPVPFKEAILKAINNFTDYRTRSRRSEFWNWFILSFLILFAVILVVQKVGSNVFGTIITIIIGLINLVFTIPLTVRRLHDIGISGYFVLFGLIPLFGAIFLLVLAARDSQRESNIYGYSPKYNSTAGFVSPCLS